MNCTRTAYIFSLIFLAAVLNAADNPNALPESDYPYWPSYQYLELEDLDTIQAQEWINEDHVIHGWDWSLPGFVYPSPRSLVGLQRNFGFYSEFKPIDLKFKSNSIGILWVDWRDIEPTMGNYDFTPIIDRIEQANSVGSDIILRILCHSKSRNGDISKGEAPLWLEGLGVNLLPQEDPGHNLNFDPSHPEFHKHYLMLIDELAKTGIPDMVKAAYVGYASHSFGDEGIGPYKETESEANDTVKHVRERLDAWHNAFKGQEYKVFMGSAVDYGFKKGFGVRRGFVEMYLYRIPDADMGQYVDDKGNLCVDENAPILRYQCFNGEVNEEYEEAWATDDRNYRFGNTTNSFPYRYFTSTLRALQMRCTYIHTTGHLIPEMLPFLSQELGRTVEDAPDVWTFLRTSYLKASNYSNNDYLNRTITPAEEAQGIEMKNFERWLYQRDAPGYETQPAVKIQQAIKMWMVQEDKYFDYIARKGKKIGFDIDDRWIGTRDSVAIKVTYFDHYPGELKLVYHNGLEPVQKTQQLMGDSALRTATFIVPGIESNNLEHNFDFTLEAGEGTDSIVVSFIRVVHSDVSSGQLETREEAFPENTWGVYSWFGLDRVNREDFPNIKGTPIILRWSALEPENGKFEFEKLIGEQLEKLDQNDFNTFLMVWVAFATSNVTDTDTNWAFTPKWIFNNGVPLVEFPETVNPLGVTTKRYFPYYLDEDYRFFFHRMIDSLGNYICNLPPQLKNRILFLQSAEGSTGDGQPYKGSPIDTAYEISKEQWSRFRIETWEKYKSAFTRNRELQLPLLTNYDSNEEEQYLWMLDSLPKALGLKNGMFSHGYHISEAQERLANFIDFRNQVEARGKVFFARGEQDAEWKTYGWSTQNPKQAFYWSALYATHCGLTMWNVPWEACQGETYADAINLFNRYAAETSPQRAKGAFCALRRGLDASDTVEFPESIYGEAVKSDTQRYIDIADAFSEYGANQGDPDKAIGGGMVNRKRMDYNDVGWKILKGNYQRHLTQIDPEETSAAWWQVDTSVYGRFARGFEHGPGKDTLFFDLDDRFYGSRFLGGSDEVLIQVIYRDGDPGSWKLAYDAIDGTMKTAMEISNTGTGGWKSKNVVLNDAYLGNRGPRGADLMLVNTGGTNCRFHMIAVDRTGQTDFPIEETTRSTYQNNSWQFPGDTLSAWQYDYIQNTSGIPLFALDSARTIGLYGCNDTSGVNIRAYNDATEYTDAAQFKWDDGAQTFNKNGQWLEYSVEFKDEIPYQLLLRARNNVDASFKLTVYNNMKDTVFYKDIHLNSDFVNLGGGNEHTDWMLSKFPFTHLWGTYVVRFDWYDNVGDPGIFGSFSFVSSNLDITPPGWYFVSVGDMTLGSEIIVITTEDSKVYLVPSGTASDTTSIITAAVAMAEVTAYNQAKLATSGLMAGDYTVFAIDGSNNISDASKVIRLQYPLSDLELPKDPDIQLVFSQESQIIKVISKNDLGKIHVFDMLGKRVGSKECNGKKSDILMPGLVSGVYLVRVFEKDGTVTTIKIHKN